MDNYSYNSSFSINGRLLSKTAPTYFIADIASNHDGDIERAKELIFLAKAAGADAVKFQHFLAEKIVSDYGFRHLGKQAGHQSAWKKSVFEVFRDAECHREWNSTLAETAEKANIDFLTTPYDVPAVDGIDKYVPVYKIGSGDITWTEFISYVAKKNKPVLLATGASEISDVIRAVDSVLTYNKNLLLMQCNTNYTGNIENMKYVNLNVLKMYAVIYPDMLLGLSDHTPGHATVLGAITLGARAVEKHFTSDTRREGPDHAFSMDPVTWRDMVDRARELESAMGTGIKRVEENEQETVVLQQRCLRLTRDIKAGEQIGESDVEALRPAPRGAYRPFEKNIVLGRVLSCDMEQGQELYPKDLA